MSQGSHASGGGGVEDTADNGNVDNGGTVDVDGMDLDSGDDREEAPAPVKLEPAGGSPRKDKKDKKGKKEKKEKKEKKDKKGKKSTPKKSTPKKSPAKRPTTPAKSPQKREPDGSDDGVASHMSFGRVKEELIEYPDPKAVPDHVSSDSDVVEVTIHEAKTRKNTKQAKKRRAKKAQEQSSDEGEEEGTFNPVSREIVKIALRLGLPGKFFSSQEQAIFGREMRTDVEKRGYYYTRSLIGHMWLTRPKKRLYLSTVKKMAVPSQLRAPASVFDFLTTEGYINQGVLREKYTTTPNGRSVVIIGAGLSGLIAAQHLKRAGFSVTVLEGSNSIGGRCGTAKIDGKDVSLGPPNRFPLDAVIREHLEEKQRSAMQDVKQEGNVKLEGDVKQEGDVMGEVKGELTEHSASVKAKVKFGGQEVTLRLPVHPDLEALKAAVVRNTTLNYPSTAEIAAYANGRQLDSAELPEAIEKEAVVEVFDPKQWRVFSWGETLDAKNNSRKVARDGLIGEVSGCLPTRLMVQIPSLERQEVWRKGDPSLILIESGSEGQQEAPDYAPGASQSDVQNEPKLEEIENAQQWAHDTDSTAGDDEKKGDEAEAHKPPADLDLALLYTLVRQAGVNESYFLRDGVITEHGFEKDGTYIDFSDPDMYNLETFAEEYHEGRTKESGPLWMMNSGAVPAHFSDTIRGLLFKKLASWELKNHAVAEDLPMPDVLGTQHDDTACLPFPWNTVCGCLANGIKIERSKQVQEIEWATPDGGARDYVVVRYFDPLAGMAKEVRANHCVVTVPIGVLKRTRAEGGIDFVPPLDDVKQHAIENISSGSRNTMVLAFDTPFWTSVTLNEQRIERGNVSFFESLRERRGFAQFYFETSPPHISVALVGKASQEAEVDENRHALVEEVMVLLRNAFKECEVPEPKHVELTNWAVHPFAYGSGPYLDLHIEDRAWGEAVVSALAKPEGNLFFGGDATVFNGMGTTHGAVRSGVRVARDIIMHHRDLVAAGKVRVPPLTPAERIKELQMNGPAFRVAGREDAEVKKRKVESAPPQVTHGSSVNLAAKYHREVRVPLLQRNLFTRPKGAPATADARRGGTINFQHAMKAAAGQNALHRLEKVTEDRMRHHKLKRTRELAAELEDEVQALARKREARDREEKEVVRRHIVEYAPQNAVDDGLPTWYHQVPSAPPSQPGRAFSEGFYSGRKQKMQEIGNRTRLTYTRNLFATVHGCLELYALPQKVKEHGTERRIYSKRSFRSLRLRITQQVLGLFKRNLQKKLGVSEIGPKDWTKLPELTKPSVRLAIRQAVDKVLLTYTDPLKEAILATEGNSAKLEPIGDEMLLTQGLPDELQASQMKNEPFAEVKGEPDLGMPVKEERTDDTTEQNERTDAALSQGSIASFASLEDPDAVVKKEAPEESNHADPNGAEKADNEGVGEEAEATQETETAEPPPPNTDEVTGADEGPSSALPQPSSVVPAPADIIPTSEIPESSAVLAHEEDSVLDMSASTSLTYNARPHHFSADNVSSADYTP